MRFPLLLIIVLGFSLASCTGWRIEKRHYRNGFYFNRSESVNAVQSGDNCTLDSAAPVVTENLKIETSQANNDSASAETIATGNVDTHEAKPTTEDDREQTIAETHTKTELPSPEDDPVERQIKKTKVLGIIALILVIIGLAGLEVSVYTFPLLLIGIGLAIFGLKIGKPALQNTKYSSKDKSGKKVPDPRRKRAKNAYWLCLSALLLIVAYLLVRIIIAGGLSTIGIALILLGLCLLAFLFFKMGVFSDLSDQ